MINRRKFLQTTVAGIGAAAISAPAFAHILIPQKKKTLGVALVGLGYYSTDLLAPALQLTENCKLTGIVTGTPAKAEQWKKAHKLKDSNIYDYSNFDSIANNPEIDVIYVVLPPAMHAEYTIRAANAGKHVWCEKPMAMTEKECQAMIDACTKNKVKLSIGYRMQHEPNTQQIIRFGKDKTYGNIQSLSASAGYFDGRSDHWKQNRKMGGGAMYDMGVYSLNAARYSTGLEPIAVTAKQSTTRPHIYKGTDETMQFDLEFSGGITASCLTSLGQNLNSLEVKCSNGWYSLSPFQSYSGIQGRTSDGKKLDSVIENQQAKQMDEDAQSILDSSKVLVPGEEGLKDIRVVEAIFRSASENKRIEIS
jgi:glucose-fructose oxidoreductase